MISQIALLGILSSAQASTVSLSDTVFFVAAVSGGNATWVSPRRKEPNVKPFDATNDPKKWLAVYNGESFFTTGNAKVKIVKIRRVAKPELTDFVSLKGKAPHWFDTRIPLTAQASKELARFKAGGTPKGPGDLSPGILIPDKGMYRLEHIPVVSFKLPPGSYTLNWKTAIGSFKVKELGFEKVAFTISLDKKLIESTARQNQVEVDPSKPLVFEIVDDVKGTVLTTFVCTAGTKGVQIPPKPNILERVRAGISDEEAGLYADAVLRLAKECKLRRLSSLKEVARTDPGLATEVSNFLGHLSWGETEFNYLISQT
jgi:hypothetical protein